MKNTKTSNNRTRSRRSLERIVRRIGDSILDAIFWPFCVIGDILGYFWPMSAAEKAAIWKQVAAKIEKGDYTLDCHCKKHDDNPPNNPMSFSDLSADYQAAIEALVRKHQLASDALTETQVVDLIRQLFASGDIFTQVCVTNGGQSVVYIPYREVESLRSTIQRLKVQLAEHGIKESANDADYQ